VCGVRPATAAERVYDDARGAAVGQGNFARSQPRGPRAATASGPCYARREIRDRAAYQRLRIADEHRALRELDMETSIAMTEALLTSSLMDHVDRRNDPRPLDLVRALRIDPARVVRTADQVLRKPSSDSP
jgi:hypothetical protein